MISVGTEKINIKLFAEIEKTLKDEKNDFLKSPFLHFLHNNY